MVEILLIILLLFILAPIIVILIGGFFNAVGAIFSFIFKSSFIVLFVVCIFTLFTISMKLFSEYYLYIFPPFLTMIVFTFIFGNVAKLPSEGDAPYALMVFAALLPWQFFSGALTEASTSLLSNANLVSKVYFPRMIIPISAVITTFIDFLISLFILIMLMVYYQFIPPFQILLLPIFMFLVFLTSFGAGLFFSALNVKYRDFRYVIPFIVQMGLYVSPVGFSSSIVPEKYELLYYLNPLVGIIDGFRWCILGGESNLNHYALIFSSSITFLLLFLSIKYFRNVEKAFADHI